MASTYASVARKPFADAFLRFAVSVAVDYADRIESAVAALPRGVLAPLSVRYVRVAPGRSRMTVTFPRARAGAATTLVYRLEGDPGEPARTREVAPLVGDRGRRLSFTVATSPSRSAVLVLSNGGERPVAYAVERAEPRARGAARRHAEPVCDPDCLDDKCTRVVEPRFVQRLSRLEQRVRVHAALLYQRDPLQRLVDQLAHGEPAPR